MCRGQGFGRRSFVQIHPQNTLMLKVVLIRFFFYIYIFKRNILHLLDQKYIKIVTLWHIIRIYNWYGFVLTYFKMYNYYFDMFTQKKVSNHNLVSNACE